MKRRTLKLDGSIIHNLLINEKKGKHFLAKAVSINKSYICNNNFWSNDGIKLLQDLEISKWKKCTDILQINVDLLLNMRLHFLYFFFDVFINVSLYYTLLSVGLMLESWLVSFWNKELIRFDKIFHSILKYVEINICTWSWRYYQKEV